MDLPQIGAHCSHSACNVLDFLPITCSCGALYCSQHISPDHHACPTLAAKQAVSTFSDKIPRCDLAACSKPSLQIYNGDANETCTHCHKSFCVEHRYAEMHHCPSLPLQDGVMQEKMSATKKQLLPPAFSLPKRKPPKDPIKLAQWQKVEAMKMRHRASPADPKDKAASLPPDQRLHVRVTLGDAEKIFWVRKTVITGRALDLLALHFIPAIPQHESLQLCKLIESAGGVFDCTPLQNDLLLEKQIKDGESLAIRSL